MRAFNKEDYDLVIQYEADFKRAIESRYAKGITKEEFNLLSRIYRETLNRQANYSCGGCVLQMLTSIGRLYFNFKDKLMKEEERLKKEEEEKKKNSQKPRSRGRRVSDKNKEDKKDVHKDKIEVQGGEGSPGDVSDNK